GLENDPDVKAAMGWFGRAGTQKDVQAAFDAATKAAGKARDTMARYGLSLDDAGTATERLTRHTKTFVEDAARLTGLGFTLEQVTRGGAAQLNAMLSAAIETGQKLPAAMRPYVEELIRSGQLTDELREKLLGVSPVPWQEMQEA